MLTGKWFHGGYLADVFTPGQKVALYGKVEFDSYSGNLAMMHPEYEILSGDEDGDASLHTGRVVPIYEAAGKVTTRIFRVLHASDSGNHRADVTTRCPRTSSSN